MEFNKKVLCAAVAAATLTACGGGSSSSNTPAPTPSPDPSGPSVPAPLVLTDEQKQTLGKVFVSGLSQQVTSLSSDSATLVKSFLDASNAIDQEENPGDYEMKQGVAVLSGIIPPVRIEMFQAAQKVFPAEGEAEVALGEAIPLTFERSYETENNGPGSLNIALTGTVVVTKGADGADIFTFDAKYIVTEQEDTPVESDLQLVVTEGILDYTPEVAGDPADTDYQLSISGTLTNADMTMTLENAALSAVSDEEEGEGPVSGAVKQVSFNIASLNVETSAITVQAGVDVLFEQPLQSNEGEYFYSGYKGEEYQNGDVTTGSLGIMASQYGGLSIPTPPPFISPNEAFQDVINVIEGFTPVRDGAARSLNIRNMSLVDVKVTQKATGDYLSLSDASFTGNDDLYAADLNMYGGSIAPLGDFEFNEDRSELVVSSSLGKATYTFKETVQVAEVGSGPMVTGYVTCEREAESMFVEGFVGFADQYGGCVDLEAEDYNDPISTYASLDAWLEDGANGGAVWVPNGGTYPQVLVNFEETEENKGQLVPYASSYESKASIDHISQPIDFTVSAEGAVSVDGELTPFSVELDHPSSMDYKLKAQLGEEASGMLATWSTMDPNFELKAKVPYLGQYVNAGLNVDFTSIQTQMIELERNEELAEQAEMQLKEKGFITISIGSIVIEGLQVGTINLHSSAANEEGVGFIPGNNPFSFPEGLPFPSHLPIAVSIVMFDDSAPTGDLFANVEEFSQVRKAVDCPVDDELEPVAKPLMVKECFEPETVSLNGVIDLESLTESFLGGLAPYSDRLKDID